MKTRRYVCFLLIFLLVASIVIPAYGAPTERIGMAENSGLQGAVPLVADPQMLKTTQ